MNRRHRNILDAFLTLIKNTPKTNDGHWVYVSKATNETLKRLRKEIKEG